MAKPRDNFAEIPRWVRLLDAKRWFGGAGFSRRDFRVVEAFCLSCALVVFAAYFLTHSPIAARILPWLGILSLACACFVSANIRLGDRYRLWRDASNESPVRPRTWRTRTLEYACLFGVGIVGTVILYWLVF
jgi:hypothetical protein